MRHGNKINHLGKKTAHREAMLSNLAIALIRHKRINTTLAKAKELRKFIEPLLTKTKEDTTHNRRTIFSYLKFGNATFNTPSGFSYGAKESIKELFGEISSKIADRPGGYTRIIKLGHRPGDAAEMGMIELVDFNEIYNKENAKAGKTRRSRRKKGETAVVENATEAEVIPTDEIASEAKETKATETATEE